MGVQTAQENDLTPVYEQVSQGFEKMSLILERIIEKLDVRQPVTVTSKRIAIMSYNVGTDAVRIVVPEQRRLTLSNQGANPIYLAQSAQATTDDASYELDSADPPLTIETAAEIWAFVEADTERLDIIAEME